MNTTLINRWNGGKARLWNYSVSHKMLTLRVEQEGRYGNLHIYCGDLSFVCGPSEWRDACFEIEVVSSDLVILRDKHVDFQAHAGIMEVAENCKPIY